MYIATHFADLRVAHGVRVQGDDLRSATTLILQLQAVVHCLHLKFRLVKIRWVSNVQSIIKEHVVMVKIFYIMTIFGRYLLILITVGGVDLDNGETLVQDKDILSVE